MRCERRSLLGGMIDRGRIGGLYPPNGLLLLFEDANVAGELIALKVKLHFRGSGGIDAGGRRPEVSERVLNDIEASLRARRRA